MFKPYSEGWHPLSNGNGAAQMGPAGFIVGANGARSATACGLHGTRKTCGGGADHHRLLLATGSGITGTGNVHATRGTQTISPNARTVAQAAIPATYIAKASGPSGEIGAKGNEETRDVRELL